MADLATDPAYVETCRVAAWSARPMREIDRYWDAADRRFAFPAGWPDGVEAEPFIRRQLDEARPTGSADRSESRQSLSPSVRRMRELLA